MWWENKRPAVVGQVAVGLDLNGWTNMSRFAACPGALGS